MQTCPTTCHVHHEKLPADTRPIRLKISPFVSIGRTLQSNHQARATAPARPSANHSHIHKLVQQLWHH